MQQAIGYLRTSSSSNVGADKDSMIRQGVAIQAAAQRAGLNLVASFADGAVSGADHLDSRASFSAALSFCRETGCRTIICESASRFARDLIVAETGHAMLAKEGITLVAADDPNAFDGSTPTSKLIRQILASVAEFEKAGIVAKLRGARERRSASLGSKCCGRGRIYSAGKPELIAAARALASTCSLRVIAEKLAAQGHVTATGRRFDAAQVRRFLA